MILELEPIYFDGQRIDRVDIVNRGTRHEAIIYRTKAGKVLLFSYSFDWLTRLVLKLLFGDGPIKGNRP